jgi:acid phosphatase (class A)
MKKRVLAVCLASLFSNAFALVPAGNDVTTKPDLYYLTNAQAIDSLRCCRRRRKWAVSRF